MVFEKDKRIADIILEEADKGNQTIKISDIMTLGFSYGEVEDFAKRYDYKVISNDKSIYGSILIDKKPREAEFEDVEIKFFKAREDKVPYKTMKRSKAREQVQKWMNEEPDELAFFLELEEAIMVLDEIVYPYF